jgi:hypothetical protein
VSRGFAVTYDYLCPFARNVNEAIGLGLRAGRDWIVRFVPFSLSQTKVQEGDEPVWQRDSDDPRASGVTALKWGLAVRETAPDRFLDYHLASFAARHDHGRDINDEGVLADVAASAGLDPGRIRDQVASGEPARLLMDEHNDAVTRWKVFGVPTIIEGDHAVFVRLMERGRADELDRVLDMLAWTDLNEFKRTVVPR